MKASHLIAFNTLASYGQSVVGVIVGLFSARWVLQALGATDFGLFGVVGSLILLLAFLNGGLAVGVGRFYAYAIGQAKAGRAEAGNEELKRWFNTALSTHLALGLLILFAGWPLGEFAIRHWLNIPPDRLEACVKVFQVSIFAGFFSVAVVPFTALFSAHQAIAELAVFGILQNLITLGLAWTLLSVQSDRLVFYAVGMTGIAISIMVLQALRAVWKFPCCRPSLAQFFNPSYFRQLFAFVGWKAFGTACVGLREQGTPIMTNLLFGPAVNAAYSVSSRLAVQANALSSSLMSAVQPTMNTTEGMGDRQKMLHISLRLCRLSTLLSMFFVCPLLLEMDTLLAIWLKTPPDYSSTICRWMLAALLIDRMTIGSALAVTAAGKIAVYEIIQGPLLLSVLPILWMFSSMGIGPTGIGAALFISGTAYCLARVLLAKSLTGLSITLWIKTVFLPTFLTFSVGITVGYISYSLMEPGLLRIFIITTFTGLFTILSGFIFLLIPEERNHLHNILAGWLHRLLGKSGQTPQN